MLDFNFFNELITHFTLLGKKIIVYLGKKMPSRYKQSKPNVFFPTIHKKK